METRGVVSAAILLATLWVSPVLAQDPRCGDEWQYSPQEVYLRADLSRIERVYLESLTYPVEGVVECALREIGRLKLARPGWESEGMKIQLGELAHDGMTPAIRYKASLVRSLFEAPVLFRGEFGTDFRTPAQMYRALARRLEVNLLAGN